jgi:hypothetical protein
MNGTVASQGAPPRMQRRKIEEVFFRREERETLIPDS